MKRNIKFIIGVFLSMVLACGTAAALDITIGMKLEPSSIDPHYHNLGPNNGIVRHIFDRLINMDEKQRLLPGLAESWKPLNDTTCRLGTRCKFDRKFGICVAATGAISSSNIP